MIGAAVIDTNNLFWINRHRAHKKIASGGISGEQVFSHSIFLTLSHIEQLKQVFQNESLRFFFLFDNPTSKIEERKTLDPLYKSDRDRTAVPKEFYFALGCLKEILKVSSENYYIISGWGYEADDLTPLSKKIISEDPSLRGNTVFCSKDLDWARNLDESSYWYDWSTLRSQTSFQTEHGYWPTEDKILLCKSLRGDDSDHIPVGVRLSKTDVGYILNNYKDIKDFFSRYLESATLSQKVKEDIRFNKRRIMLNYNLVSFHKTEDSQVFRYPCKENKTILRFWYNALLQELPAKLVKSFTAENFFKRV